MKQEKRVQILNLMVECMSMRAISRIADCSINSVAKILVNTGTACRDYHNAHMRGLRSQRIEVDELWAFCYAKKNKLPPQYQRKRGFGDAWTWVAIDPDTRLIPAWLTGERNAHNAQIFMNDLRDRLESRVQLSSDGLNAYRNAVEIAFRGQVDFGMLVKNYERDGYEEAEGKYMQKSKLTVTKEAVIGNPDERKISTSCVERNNLTIRTSCKRFARRTNAHSKKIENHNHALALHFMYYNFCRIHSTLRVTPAMEAGIAGHAWNMEDIDNLAQKEKIM